MQMLSKEIVKENALLMQATLQLDPEKDLADYMTTIMAMHKHTHRIIKLALQYNESLNENNSQNG